MHYNTAKANIADQKDKRKSLRCNMTPAEATLWRALRSRGASGFKFRRQQGIGPYVLDFYCPEIRLCIELDGTSHDYRYDYDEQRSRYLAAQGIHVLRFSNEQVWTCFDGVVAEIIKTAERLLSERGDTDPTPQKEVTDPTPAPPLGGEGSGCAQLPRGEGHSFLVEDE